MFHDLREWWRRATGAGTDPATDPDHDAWLLRRLEAVDEECLALMLDPSVPGRGQRLRALDLAAADLRGELAVRSGRRSAEPVRHEGRTVR